MDPLLVLPLLSVSIQRHLGRYQAPGTIFLFVVLKSLANRRIDALLLDLPFPRPSSFFRPSIARSFLTLCLSAHV